MKLESWISFCRSTMTVTVNKINLTSKWFAMIVCSCSAENCVSILFGNGVKLEFGGNLPCNSDLYVLSIETVIGLIQRSPLLRCQVVLQIL